MKFVCDKVHLEPAVATVSRAVNPKSPLPVLGHILVRRDRVACGWPPPIWRPAWSASSGQGDARRRLYAAAGAARGDCAASGRRHPGRAPRRDGGTALPAGLLPRQRASDEEFPALPQVNAELGTPIPQKVLRNGLRSAAVATATEEETRAVLQGVQIDALRYPDRFRCDGRTAPRQIRRNHHPPAAGDLVRHHSGPCGGGTAAHPQGRGRACQLHSCRTATSSSPSIAPC